MWKNIENITELIKNSINKTDILNKLGLKNNGGNFNTLTSFIRQNGIDISHFDYKKSTKIRQNKTNDIVDILVSNSTYKSSNHLKKRLYKEGLKERVCEICGQGEEWNGNRMSLILDHISGDRYDNRIENLRIVCPNCNATLDTHCRGLNKKSDTKYNVKVKDCEGDGCLNKIKKRNKFCKQCYIKSISKDVKPVKTKKEYQESIRRVERPSYEQLLKEIEEFGYVGVGKKYSVSDNAVRKWRKMYEKYGVEF